VTLYTDRPRGRRAGRATSRGGDRAHRPPYIVYMQKLEPQRRRPQRKAAIDEGDRAWCRVTAHADARGPRRVHTLPGNDQRALAVTPSQTKAKSVGASGGGCQTAALVLDRSA
jgi:hypothetical protein